MDPELELNELRTEIAETTKEIIQLIAARNGIARKDRRGEAERLAARRRPEGRRRPHRGGHHGVRLLRGRQAGRPEGPQRPSIGIEAHSGVPAQAGAHNPSDDGCKVETAAGGREEADSAGRRRARLPPTAGCIGGVLRCAVLVQDALHADSGHPAANHRPEALSGEEVPLPMPRRPRSCRPQEGGSVSTQHLPRQ